MGLMDTTKHLQIGAQSTPSAFARIAMHLALPIAIVIARPLRGAVADRPMRWMASAIASRLIGIQHCAAHRNVLIDQKVAGLLIGMVTNPETMFTALARDQIND